MKIFSKFTAGFTLVEMLVSLGIITMLFSIVIFNYGTFNDNLAISSAAQEIAITIRQAQAYGLNVRENIVGGNNFNSAYGIFFDTSSGANTNYYIFVDAYDSDKLYDAVNGCGSGNTECVEKVPLRNGVFIYSVNTTTNGGCIGATKLDVTFLRPSPDAIINFENSSSNVINSCASSPDAQITLKSPKGTTLTIKVDKTGQVYAQ